MTTFKCDLCGLCCQNLDKNPIYKELHNGDGICKHYHRASKKCTIYETRPILCRVEEGFKLFQKRMSFDEYLSANAQVCIEIKFAEKK